MAQVSFTSNFTTRVENYADKLKVEPQGSTARVSIVTAPERFYVHQINMPIVDPATGETEKDTRENRKGEKYEVDKTEFVGAYLCTGDDEALESFDRFDPENCVFCNAIKEHGDTKFRRPEPKYASWVIKYKVNSSGEVQLDPFQVEMSLWVMSQGRFDSIVRVANEHGDPMKLDLLLGPVKSVQFQNYEISPGGKCYWREDKDRQKFVASLLKSNKVGTDEGDEIVKNTVARTASATTAEMTINKVLDRHAMIGRPASAGPATAGAIEFGGAAEASRKAEKEEGSWSAPKENHSAPAPDFVEDTSKETNESAVDDDDDLNDFEDILAQLGAN